MSKWKIDTTDPDYKETMPKSPAYILPFMRKYRVEICLLLLWAYSLFFVLIFR